MGGLTGRVKFNSLRDQQILNCSGLRVTIGRVGVESRHVCSENMLNLNPSV